MATIKAFSDLQQSKVLAGILPLESADMFLAMNGTIPVMSKYIDDGLVTADETAIPCWSLAALFKLLPKSAQLEKGNVTELYRVTLSVELEVSDWYTNPIDACYEIILKLNKLKIL